ncbi:putative AMID-like mitochondrial oxidoreductase [Aspergillus bombycis]|uniref:Putative AMID-like mitochondrial oxidoreductase n=1 Tax=Aspergillus bombycis TaxID=109264 RepID=A0A1F8AAK4_9EURO|nr:putative AMID-like mitochondrial oxidoreductase [Aspergillus bombycis]OGM48409.1 putative AMID-like mitochondrial oxidoreductase [Aspergillus bombycis]
MVTAERRDIVVLGGSYAGVSAAHYLLKHVVPKLPDPEGYQVTLISASSHALCRSACPRALISDQFFDQEKLFVNIFKVFEQYQDDRIRNFRFIHGTVTQLDHTGRNVTVNFTAKDTTDTIDFHALVVATGASTPSPLLGLNRDVGDLRANWTAFRAALPTAKSILISGGGQPESRQPLVNPTVPITVVTSGPQILPLLRPSLASLAEQYLAQVGVTVIKSARVQNVATSADSKDPLTAKTTVTLEDGQTLGADLYIPATGTRANASFIGRPLLTPDGRIDTNPSTLRVDKAGPRVYAIGDVSSWARPTVHFIVEAIPVLCANMKRDLLLAAGEDESSVGEDRLFKEDTRETQVVPIGQSKGVGAAMGYRLPSFLVWLMKGRDYWLWTTEKLWSGRQWSKEL